MCRVTPAWVVSGLPSMGEVGGLGGSDVTLGLRASGGGIVEPGLLGEGVRLHGGPHPEIKPASPRRRRGKEGHGSLPSLHSALPKRQAGGAV